MADQPVIWLVLQPHGISGIFTDEDEARKIAEASGNVLTHLPLTGNRDLRWACGSGPLPSSPGQGLRV